ncbi:MAG TPA: D-glucuronyl C5-epimerase family protein, partial [Ktedonobacterales bacterium]
MERTDATPHKHTKRMPPTSGSTAAERQGRQSGLPTGTLPPYPSAETPARALRGPRLDADGVPIRRAGRAQEPTTYDPREVTRYALAQWNRYVATQDARARAAFLTQAQWLAAHAVALPGEGCGWPVPLPRPAERAWGPWLSAPVQTAAIAILARAHRLTGEETYLRLARSAASTLSRDILDGGVLAPVGGQAIWLEEVAVYPAGHALQGMLQANIGLYDIAALLDDPALPPLMGQAHDSLHRLLEYFETGYWTRADLLGGRLASSARHRQHARLLGVLARYTGCAQCAAIARRWQRFLRRPDARARFLLARGISESGRGLLRLYRRVVLRAARPPAPSPSQRMSVPITAYPVAGGMRAVLATWRATMAGSWQMEFLTRVVGPEPEGQIIHSFGVRSHRLRFKATSPAHFPQVWLYDWVGYRALRRLLRAPAGYSAVLPQDGLFTAAYAGVAARLAGVPVIPVDHGNVHALFNPEWHRELLAPLRHRALPRRIVGELSLRLYWRSLRLLARLSSRLMEHALVASDDIAGAYQRHLQVPAHRVTRFPFVVDVHRYAPVAEATRAAARAQLGVPEDAIVVVMVNRLAPEKDLETAV